MTPRTYPSPIAFKQALEQRLKDLSKSGVDFARRRQLVVFDRFLARVVHIMGESVILKGGLVLEMRLERARTTKDVDLRLVGSKDDVFQQLRRAVRLDLADFMTFEVNPDAKHPEITNDGMLYDGLRYRVEAKLAGKLFGQPFGVDVAFADVIIGQPDVVVASDILSFAGITPPTLQLYPLETHIAEKLHAYTMPRDRPNSRIKDLPDLALLGGARPIESTWLRQALEQTFDARKTHSLPAAVPEPPPLWTDVYARMADEDNLEWKSLQALTTSVSTFLNPILDNNQTSKRWHPEDWAWFI